MENVAEGEFKKNVAELRLVAQFIHGVEKTTMLFSSTSAHNINSLPPPILRGQKDDIRVELKVEIQALRKSNFKMNTISLIAIIFFYIWTKNLTLTNTSPLVVVAGYELYKRKKRSVSLLNSVKICIVLICCMYFVLMEYVLNLYVLNICW